MGTCNTAFNRREYPQTRSTSISHDEISWADSLDEFQKATADHRISNHERCSPKAFTPFVVADKHPRIRRMKRMNYLQQQRRVRDIRGSIRHSETVGTTASPVGIDNRFEDTLRLPIDRNGIESKNGLGDFVPWSPHGEAIPPGAIGFDWFTAGWGGVSWLISRPR